ncbi:hypothetical protein Y032_0009g623 [Ancylostoma ceylanicum]|uniref:Uncharacterized protein n=1 Tax=Ancylostoma ceylanicum TaxID=53326 RepID=A0A016VJR5_9BILA|nr:hypothetical protein Y032_0009g623 [Ancylostoma ceylanicum]
MDLSLLGYDCSHFSERGLSILHMAVWNSLFTKRGCGSTAYHLQNCCAQTSVARSFFPVSTFSSSGYCIYNAAHTSRDQRVYGIVRLERIFYRPEHPEDSKDSCSAQTQPIGLKSLDEEPSIYSTLITAIVLFFMCRKPRRTEDIKKTGESVWCEFQPHQIHR